MKLALLLLGIVLLAGVEANVAVTAQPVVNATFSETVFVSQATLQVKQTSAQVPISVWNKDRATLSLLLNSLETILLRPNNALNDDVYSVLLRAQDKNENIGSYPFEFRVQLPQQRIRIVEPELLGTNDPLLTIVVESENSSDCRWSRSATRVLNASGFSSMTAIANTENDKTIHSFTGFFSGQTPVNGQKYPLAVTCLSGGVYSGIATAIEFVSEPPCVSTSGCGAASPQRQSIILDTPREGITTNRATSFIINTTLGSQCRYELSREQRDTALALASMTVITDVSNNGLRHTVPNIFSRLQTPVQAEQTVFVSVSCNDSRLLTPAVFPITYKVEPQNQQRITLELPENRVTTSTTTPLRVRSDLQSVCRWTSASSVIAQSQLATQFPQLRSFAEVSPERRLHTISNFYQALGSTPSALRTDDILVVCQANTEYSQAVFSINYQPPLPPQTSPSLELRPVIVTAVQNPRAPITIVSDQDVWCTAAGVALTGPKTQTNFNRTVYGSHPFTGGTTESNFSVAVCCDNRVGLQTCKPQEVQYRPSSTALIRFLSPSATNSATYTLQFVTNTPSRCTATRAGQALTLNPAASQEAVEWNSSAVQMQTGTTDFVVSCTTPSGQTATATLSVSADRTPPVVHNLLFDGVACNPNVLQFEVNASDPAPSSNITHYEYTIFTSTNQVLRGPVNETTAKIRASNLRMNTTQHSISVRVFDGAGNPSAVKRENILIVNENDTRCDTEPPLVLVAQVLDRNRVNLTFACKDDKSGCKDTLQYTLNRASDTCAVPANATMHRYDQVLHVTNSSVVCYLAEDKAGNQLRAQTRVQLNGTSALPPPVSVVNTTAGTCTDGIKNRDETGIDCGGYACGVLLKLLCPAGQQCEIGSDCQSGQCQGGLCQGSACTNGIRDTGESDVDCGGTCPSCEDGKRCLTANDCRAGSSCIQQFCSRSPEREQPAPEIRDDFTESGSSVNIFKILIIILGLLMLVGGTGGAILYEKPRTVYKLSALPYTSTLASTSPSLSSISSASEPAKPVVIPQDTYKDRHKKSVEDRRSRLSVFDSADEVSKVKQPTHTDIERAAKELPKEEMKKAAKTLASEGKTSKKDAAIAVKDLEAAGEGKDAIEALKDEFKLDK